MNLITGVSTCIGKTIYSYVVMLLWPHGLCSPLLCGVGCHFLLQGIFLIQRWNTCLLQVDSLPLSHWGSHITLQYSCLGNPMNRVRHDLESKQKQQIYELLNLLFQIHVGSRTPCQNPTFSWDLPQSFGNYLSEAHEVRCVCTHAPPLPLPQRHPLLKEVCPIQYTTSL